MSIGEEQPLLASTPSQDHTLVRESNTDSLIGETCLELNKIWKIAGPSIFSRLALFSMTVITQSFAGHLGNTDLAAISIACTFIISITFGFLLGMASALETLCGQAYGAKQYHLLGIYLQLRRATSGGGGANRFGGDLVDPISLELPISVLAAEILAMPAENCRHSMGFGGCSGNPCTVLGLLGYTVFGGCKESWNGFSAEAFVGLWEFFKLSAASGVMLSLENMYYRFLVIMSGYMHNTEVAIDGLSICVTILAWESMIPLGFLASTGVRVANELGAGNVKGAKFATVVSVANTILVGFAFWLIIVCFSEELALIFTSTSSVIRMVNKLATLLAFTVLLNCVQPVLSGVAVGSGWQALVAYISIGSYYLVGIPMGILLGWLLPSGITGVWTGMMSGTVVQTLILAIITVKCDWEKEAHNAQSRIRQRAVNNS
ncbi:hypothetical protein L6164_016036 [Bauhinia variegata]|uniref:Uncharacterized protein n=1 Tax=Bauhinia variegata TaxID=167791 RepID=A0ACB9NNA6_BAUVA|nr:hypothetical protein L6164_016036 [Bauhinia variegata]